MILPSLYDAHFFYYFIPVFPQLAMEVDPPARKKAMYFMKITSTTVNRSRHLCFTSKKCNLCCLHDTTGDDAMDTTDITHFSLYIFNKSGYVFYCDQAKLLQVKIKQIKATHGLPQTIVSDNAPSITSAECMRKWNTPYYSIPHPTSWQNEPFKHLSTLTNFRRNCKHKISSIFIPTPHSVSLAQLLMNHKLRLYLNISYIISKNK